MLLDINNSKQIPPDRQIDLSLEVPADAYDELILDIDRKPREGLQPTKSLKQLLEEPSHLDYAAVAERSPHSVTDLLTGVDSPAADPIHQQEPPSFLTADDIDNYMYEADCKIRTRAEENGEDYEMLPTMAPLARDGGSAFVNGSYVPTKDASTTSISSTARDFALRNPTSVYNWLRKNAPGTFLQDAENAVTDKPDKNVGDHDDDHEVPKKTSSTSARAAGGRKSGASGEGGKAATSRASGASRAKRTSASAAKDKRKPPDEMDEDMGFLDMPSILMNKGKRKRNADDDTGYRPKGGASRRPPNNRKRGKSTSGAGPDGDAITPTAAKRPRKSVASAAPAREEVEAAGDD